MARKATGVTNNCIGRGRVRKYRREEEASRRTVSCISDSSNPRWRVTEWSNIRNNDTQCEVELREYSSARSK